MKMNKEKTKTSNDLKSNVSVDHLKSYFVKKKDHIFYY